MNRLFDIVTLSDRSRLADPITILTGSIAVLSQLFPNIFGGNRRRLTESDWIQLLPGAGYWTTSLRNYLKARIHYDTDYQTNILQYSKNFVYENASELCGGTYSENCYSNFLQKLKTETATGGNAPIGITPGGYGQTLNPSLLIPLAVGAVVLVLAMKAKKKN